MTSKYGPSVGISRLQRWERAKKWGLNPPSEVCHIILFSSFYNNHTYGARFGADNQIHSILTTKEGEDDVEYRENVLHAWL